LDCPVKPGNDEKRSTTHVTKTRAAHAPKSNDAEILRRIAGMLSLWRICGNAACRRAQAYRGRPHRCAKRNVAALPPGVRGFLKALLAAKSCRMRFKRFQEEMEGSPEAEAHFAWVAAANGRLFSSQVRNTRDAPQNAA
jgi:hypothetical protein